MSRPDSLWSNFSADPRDPSAEKLRASDRDRELVTSLLAECYADGRLDRQEYDERLELVGRAKTLGELPPAVVDLVPQTVARRDDLTFSSDEMNQRAVRAYEASRREALSSLLVLTVVLSAIWYVVSGDGFYWPVFVLLVAGANLMRLLVHKQDMIEKERRRLEARRRKSIDPPAET
jgi:hypothetical protein